MYPILFKIPLFGLFGFQSFPIRGYGVMVALGFLVGSYVVQHNAKKYGLDPIKALDLIFYIVLVAILGSRIFYVLVAEREAFFQNPLHIFKIWEGGLVFYGGFIPAFLISIWYFRRHHLPIWKYCDIFAPGIAIGHSLGRLGCFLSGCCYGRPLLESTWFSVIFPDNPDSSAPVGIPLYPTQLMESAGLFFLFLFLMFRLKRKKFDGEVMILYIILYAILRFLIEFLRGDFARGFVFGTSMSTSQLVASILFAFGMVLYLYRKRSQKGALS